MQAAARFDDPIAHTSALTGLIAGAVLGAIVAVGVTALVVGTGGLAAPLLIGAALAGGATGAWIGEFAGSLSFCTKQSGNIVKGSPDVFVNYKPLARAETDTGICSKHGPEPPLIAMGSATVFINNFHAARVNDKLTCGSFISSGSPDVFIGGGQVALKTVNSEVPWWVHGLVMGAGIVGALLLGGWAAIPALAGGFAAGWLGGEALGWVGHRYGDWLSQHIGGTPEDWEKTGAFVGQAIGGWLGAKGGIKGFEFFRKGGEINPNPLGLKDANIPEAEPVVGKTGGSPAEPVVTEPVVAKTGGSRSEPPGLETRGNRPNPGERATTREEWKAQQSRARAEETVARADQPLENPNPNASQKGHGHGDHGYQTTQAQQANRVATGATPSGRTRPDGTNPKKPGRVSRFETPEAEAEALGRGRRELENKINNGEITPYTDPVTGKPTFVDPATGEPYRTDPISVKTNRPEGFSSESVVPQRKANGQPVLDAAGNRIPQIEPGPLPKANLVYEYVPSKDEWHPVTYFPIP